MIGRGCRSGGSSLPARSPSSSLATSRAGCGIAPTFESNSSCPVVVMATPQIFTPGTTRCYSPTPTRWRIRSWVGLRTEDKTVSSKPTGKYLGRQSALNVRNWPTRSIDWTASSTACRRPPGRGSPALRGQTTHSVSGFRPDLTPGRPNSRNWGGRDRRPKGDIGQYLGALGR